MEEQMELVQKLLKTPIEYNMLPEVVYTALIEMQRNPSLTVEEALQKGCIEWDV